MSYTQLTQYCLMLSALLPCIHFLNIKLHKNTALILSSTMCIIAGSSLLCLMLARVYDDFTLLNVYTNSAAHNPLLYKIVGTWGNHEGSMLLWLWLLSIHTTIYAATSNSNNPQSQTALSIQFFLYSALCTFILKTSNPFTLIHNPDLLAAGLNPLLQDVGLAIHPPILYIGYTGFSIPFSTLIAALLQNQPLGQWASSNRSWAKASWCFLTAGIGLGCWWAYRQIGWGGIWAWDPVENISLLPWLTGTIMLHSLASTAKRQTIPHITIASTQSTFLLCIMGQMLTRSGIMVSVHSFASDPNKGNYFILIIMSLTLLASIAYIKYTYNNHSYSNPISRKSIDSWIIIGIMTLLHITIVVLIGTLYPVFIGLASSEIISIGEEYYINNLAIAVPIITLLCTASSHHQHNRQNIIYSIIANIIITCITLPILQTYTQIGISASVAIITATWCMTTNSLHAIRQLYAPNISMGMLRMRLGHATLSLTVLTICLSLSCGVDSMQRMQINDILNCSRYTIKLQNITPQINKGFASLVCPAIIYKEQKPLKRISPEIRLYTREEQQNAIAASYYVNHIHNIQITVGNYNKEDNSVLMKVHYRPFLSLVWIGFIATACNSLIAQLIIRAIGKIKNNPLQAT